MSEFATFSTRRLAAWRQTPDGRVHDVEDAGRELTRLGIVTLYPVSPEIPDLYHAYMGDPTAKTDPNWDSPSGEVYTWRWLLGRRELALYAALVRGRPTWIHWDLVPAVLRLCGDRRTPDELFDSGLLSSAAYRIASALEQAGGTLQTGELRAAAGFPTGKEQRAAYLKAVDELDTRLLVAKTFAEGDDQMRHTLVAARYPQHVAAADRLTREAALEMLLLAYLPHAVYALPPVLARHLKLPEAELRTGLERLAARGLTRAVTFPEQRAVCYVWQEDASLSPLS
jgi:hypothetical protein